VPNLAYADGRRFYQYLEEWLLHYADQDEQGRSVMLPGLRSCFKPQHDYLFTMKQGQPYSQASAFMELLRNPAYRLTGKVLTPETLRRSGADCFTAWLKEHAPAKRLYRAGSYASHTHVKPLQDEDIDVIVSSNRDQQERQWFADVAQNFVKPTAKGQAKKQKQAKSKAKSKARKSKAMKGADNNPRFPSFFTKCCSTFD
jgi:hypothetical protein